MKIRASIPSLDERYNRGVGCIWCGQNYSPLKSTACDYDGFCSWKCETKFWRREDLKDFFNFKKHLSNLYWKLYWFLRKKKFKI